MINKRTLVCYASAAILLIALAFLNANFAGKNAARGGKHLLVNSSLLKERSVSKIPREPRKSELRGKLDSIILKHMEFEDVPVERVFRELRERSRKADSKGNGVNIVLLLSKDTIHSTTTRNP